MEEANGQPTIPSIYEGTTVEYRPDIQARIYEALYRIANRTWIEGLFSFGWKYWPSHFPEYSISYTPAETVVAKWSNMVNYGNGVIVNNENKVKVEQEDFILHLEESGFYTDIRLRDSEGNNWSSWNIYQTTIDLSTILPEISTEKQYVIWLQAKNSTFTSNPTAVKVIVDSTAPKISTQPTSYDFNLSSFNSLGKIVEETSLDLLTFVFDDTSSINVEAQVTGAENYTINTTGNVFTLPIILFTEGEEGSTGHTLTWIVTDTNPSTYTIYSNDTEVTSGSWLSDQAISFSVDDLTIGSNNITILVKDSTGLSATDTTWVFVNKPEPPKFTSTPDDLTFEEGSTGHTLTWIVTDTNPLTYTIYSNGTEVTSGSWLSDQAISFSVEDLGVGSYNIT
ncbi:MAG: hypothetical protein ACTSPP_12205, partial [Candidatus Heimdallarchaeaceae archaeon]